jgi:hypothetical protein
VSLIQGRLPASASPVFPGPGCRPAAEAAQGRQGKYEPVLVRPPTLLRGTIMPGRHSVKRKKAERAEHRGVAEVVDARTLRAHLLTPDALVAGKHAAGRYIALCGQDVLPASLTEPGRGRCPSCVSIPTQRSKS